jgi:hypothetical protein
MKEHIFISFIRPVTVSYGFLRRAVNSLGYVSGYVLLSASLKTFGAIE